MDQRGDGSVELLGAEFVEFVHQYFWCYQDFKIGRPLQWIIFIVFVVGFVSKSQWSVCNAG